MYLTLLLNIHELIQLKKNDTLECLAILDARPINFLVHIVLEVYDLRNDGYEIVARRAHLFLERAEMTFDNGADKFGGSKLVLALYLFGHEFEINCLMRVFRVLFTCECGIINSNCLMLMTRRVLGG